VRDGGCERILLHILGIGSHEAQLRAQVAERGLGNHVRFEGFQENPYGFYRKADLFCLASIYEGMPNVLLEALTCRTPVLSTDCPTGPREILDGGRFGRLVPPKHVEALADGIRDVMQNPTNGVTKAAAARTDIERTFSLTARIGELEEILGEVAAVRPGNRSDFPG
jgi:glycosyltransferase involved in cell wall biosynthesis